MYMVSDVRYRDWPFPPMIWHQPPNPYLRVFDMVEVEAGNEAYAWDTVYQPHEKKGWVLPSGIW